MHRRNCISRRTVENVRSPQQSLVQSWLDRAQRAGIDKGEALIQFTLGSSGQIKNIKVIRASHPIFARNSVRIVSEYKCQGQGHDVPVLVPFGYRLE